MADFVEKVQNTGAAKVSVTEIEIYIRTFIAPIIRFRATWLASALGDTPLRVLVRKTLP